MRPKLSAAVLLAALTVVAVAVPKAEALSLTPYSKSVSVSGTNTATSFGMSACRVRLVNDGSNTAYGSFDATATATPGANVVILLAAKAQEYTFLANDAPTSVGLITASSTTTVRVYAFPCNGSGFSDAEVSTGQNGSYTGNVSISGTLGVTGVSTLTGQVINVPQAVTIADNGGGTAATGTITPTSSVVLLTCSDADGCTVTLSESGAVTGQVLRIVNMSANTATFADTSGVSETAGSFAAGQYDAISYVYATDRWVELGRSNN